MNYFRRALRFTAPKCDTEDHTHAFVRRKITRKQDGLAHLREIDSGEKIRIAAS